jgi:hypothetical protein
MSKKKIEIGGIAGLGAIGFGIYGIGQVHGYVNMIIFIIGAIISLILAYKFSGSRKKKGDCIVYNQNELFMITVLVLILTTGLYSTFRILQDTNKLGESITGYSIVMVLIFAILLPGFYAFPILKNRNDKIIITPKNLTIVDNKTTHEFLFEDLDSYQITNSNLVINLKNKEKITFKLDDLNLYSNDINSLDVDLRTCLIKP